MPHILTHDPARELSLWQDGFDVGQDVGLRLALEVVVKEHERQRGLAAIANEAGLSGESSFRAAARHEYALARLSDVATVVAVYFRATH
jgi:hypothetical protein